jgi:hypothetical protein
MRDAPGASATLRPNFSRRRIVDRLTVPVAELISHNLSIVMMYAYSRSPLKKMFEARFDGAWEGVYDTLFETAKPIAEKACLELALFFRYLDDEEERAISEMFKNTSYSFGRLAKADGTEVRMNLSGCSRQDHSRDRAQLGRLIGWRLSETSLPWPQL